MIHKYEVFLQSSDQQFGFKKKLGCTHAIFALSQCVDYFVNSGSSVFMAALDAIKAFDRVHHIKLCNRLIDTGIPIWLKSLLIGMPKTWLRSGGKIVNLLFFKLKVG